MSTQEERLRWAADATHLGGEHDHRILLLLEDIDALEARLVFAAKEYNELKSRYVLLFEKAKKFRESNKDTL